MSHTMAECIDETHQNVLCTRLESTGQRPHFFTTFDKSTLNGVTNQVVLLCGVIGGTRRSILVDAGPVYEIEMEDGHAAIVGGRDTDLAENIKKSINTHFPLVGMTHCVGAVADGQYRSPRFQECLFQHRYGNVMWDHGHLLDLIFKACHKEGPTSFIGRIVQRASIFNKKLKRGFGKMALLAASKELNESVKATKTFCHTRFFSSSLTAVRILIENFSVYQRALYSKCGVQKEEDGKWNEEEYLLFGQDFLFDCNLLLDIMEYLRVASVNSQGLKAPYWKILMDWQEAEDHLHKCKIAMEENLYPDQLFPLTSAALPEIENKQFKGSPLVDGWLIRSHTDEYNWEMRTLEESKKDAIEFTSKLIDGMKTRKKSAVTRYVKLHFQSFDISEWFLLAAKSPAEVNLESFKENMEDVQRLEHVKSALREEPEPRYIFQQALSAFEWVLQSTDDEAIKIRQRVFSLTVGRNAIKAISKCEGGKKKVTTETTVFSTKVDEVAFIEELYTNKSLFGRLGTAFCLGMLTILIFLNN